MKPYSVLNATICRVQFALACLLLVPTLYPCVTSPIALLGLFENDDCGRYLNMNNEFEYVDFMKDGVGVMNYQSSNGDWQSRRYFVYFLQDNKVLRRIYSDSLFERLKIQNDKTPKEILTDFIEEVQNYRHDNPDAYKASLSKADYFDGVYFISAGVRYKKIKD